MTKIMRTSEWDVNPQRRKFLIAGLAATAAGACFGRAPQIESMDSFILREMKKTNIPGLAAGFAENGVARWVRGYGFADVQTRRPVSTDTMFHIASLTKIVTATMVMRLVEQQRIRLDDPVAPHLDFALANPSHADVPITFRHLLMHVSSISDDEYYKHDSRQSGTDATQPIGDFLKSFLLPGQQYCTSRACFSSETPGPTWSYSNLGYALLGYLASRIGGEDMREQTRKQIFAPLRMRHTSWTIRDTPEALRATPYDMVDGKLQSVPPVGFPDWSVGMLRSSVADFTQFVAACANGGSAAGHRILDETTQRQMLEMHTPKGLPAWLTGQGLGWMAAKLDGITRPEHWGGDPGVFTAVYMNPEKRSAAVVFTNASVTPESKAVIKNIASRLLGSTKPGSG